MVVLLVLFVFESFLIMKIAVNHYDKNYLTVIFVFNLFHLDKRGLCEKNIFEFDSKKRILFYL